MPAPPPDARRLRGRSVDVRPCGDDGVVLRVALETPLPRLNAGRFFMLRREDALSPGIPRPFSVYRECDDGSLEFLIKVMGRGTQALAAATPGTELVVVGPLGNGWPELDGDGPPWVMIGGGIGSVPFYMGIQQTKSSDVTMIYGAARAGLLYDLEQFQSLGARVLAATDDGSAGFHGNVVQALEAEWAAGRIPRKVRLLACGPERMMEAVAALAHEHDLECWLSLETLMGCGVGICNGCAVFVSEDGAPRANEWPVKKCCVDGPVFAADSIRL